MTRPAAGPAVPRVAAPLLALVLGALPLRAQAVVGMLPAELSTEETAVLEHACRALSHDSTLRREPLSELIREATGAGFESPVGD